MFDKRLLKEMPEAIVFVKRQVIYQWVALITNIVFTLGICKVFIDLYK